jgi:hypothetical protein
MSIKSSAVDSSGGGRTLAAWGEDEQNRLLTFFRTKKWSVSAIEFASPRTDGVRRGRATGRVGLARFLIE